MKKNTLYLVMTLLTPMLLLSSAYAQSKPVAVQSTDDAIITGFYKHEVGAPIANPEPLWWPAWKDAIERERKIRFKNNIAIIEGDKKEEPVFIELKDNEYQYFAISYGPTWRDGDIELMASVINYNSDFCDDRLNAPTNTGPFEHCNASVTARNMVTGEIKTFRTVKKICNSGEPASFNTAKTTVSLDRKTKIITFNALSDGKIFPGCKVAIKYQ